MKKNSIKIKSSRDTCFSSSILIDGRKYFVQTDNISAKMPVIITQVFLNGQIVNTVRTDCSETGDTSDTKNRIQELMQTQHQSAISMLSPEKNKGEKTPLFYIESVKNLLAKKKYSHAFELIRDALGYYPEDPFILSYYGYLEAVVNKNYRDGIKTCNMAIFLLQKRVPFGEEFFYPFLYMNLGKAYIAAGRRKHAIDALNRAYDMDKDNKELHRILKELGIRKGPVIPILDRSNILNKYLGLLLKRFRNT